MGAVHSPLPSLPWYKLPYSHSHHPGCRWTASFCSLRLAAWLNSLMDYYSGCINCLWDKSLSCLFDFGDKSLLHPCGFPFLGAAHPASAWNLPLQPSGNTISAAHIESSQSYTDFKCFLEQVMIQLTMGVLLLTQRSPNPFFCRYNGSAPMYFSYIMCDTRGDGT